MSTLNINLSAIQDNLQSLLKISDENSIELVPVIKSFSGVGEVLKLLDNPKIKSLGLSRVSTVSHLDNFDTELSNICISLLSKDKLEESFYNFDEVYLSSEFALQFYIGLAVRHSHINLRLTFLVDCGDHREGLTPSSVYELIRKHHHHLPKNLQVAGLATTLGCNFGVLPSQKNLALLDSLSKQLNELLPYSLDTISVGGSIILKLILDNKLPSYVTQIRIGEALLLGTIPAYGIAHPSLHLDAFEFCCSVIELEEKPNFSGLEKGVDALGKEHFVSDKKVILQAILDFGILDTDMSGLTPKNANIEFCNQNSDYTMVEVCQEANSLPLVLSFKLNYRSLAQALNSDFVEKKILR